MEVVVCCSDTGTMAPERCVFGIMLDVSAFLGNTDTTPSFIWLLNFEYFG